MSKSQIPFLSLLVILLPFSLFGITPFVPTQSLVIENTNWKIYRSENLTYVSRHQKWVYQQSEQHEDQAGLLDLSLDFEGPLNRIANYRTIYANYQPNRYQAQNGQFSGKFFSAENSISLLPLSSSLFAPGNIPGSFTIEFWLYLYKNYNNQYVIRYVGNNLSDEKDKNTYGISIFTRNNRMVYQFENFFWSEKNEPQSVTMQEEDALQVYQWEHHAISFDILTGKLTVYKNGVEQEVRWMTENGRTLSPIRNPLVKSELSTPILIGQNALFSLDNLVIRKEPRESFNLHKYRNSDSFLITDVYHFSDNISSLRKLLFDADTPNYGAVKLSYRIADRYFAPDDKNIQWISVQNGLDSFPENHSSGRYVQFKAEIFPYSDMIEPITLKSIRMDYGEDKSPYIPALTQIEPLDRQARITWVPSPEDDIAGYEIYYGDHSETYLSSDAAEGKSPIFVPAQRTGDIRPMQYTLTGLKNESAYFIAIRAVDKKGHRSPYSRERYVRPSSIYQPARYCIEQ